MNQKHFVHLIADYGTGDLAFAEVIQRLKHLLPHSDILPTSVPAFSTLATGFVIAQLALNDAPENMAIFSNTAPRKDDNQKRNNNAGEEFVYAKLKNGIEIGAVNAQYAFSFIKPHIQEIRKINTQNQGSQFRSRDFYPKAFADILGKAEGILGDTIPSEDIPEIPQNKILLIDGYGNIKTTIRQDQVQFEPGEKIRISIQGNVRTAIYAHGNFSVKAGDLAFAPGSSGGDNRFMEIFLRGGNAHKLFFKPPVETDIQFERFDR